MQGSRTAHFEKIRSRKHTVARRGGSHRPDRYLRLGAIDYGRRCDRCGEPGVIHNPNSDRALCGDCRGGK